MTLPKKDGKNIHILWLGTPLIDTLATFVWRVTKQRVMNYGDD